VKEANPEAKFGDIAKIISTHFKALPAEERAYWDNKAVEDKARCEFFGCQLSLPTLSFQLTLQFMQTNSSCRATRRPAIFRRHSDSLFVLLTQKDCQVGGVYQRFCAFLPD